MYPAVRNVGRGGGGGGYGCGVAMLVVVVCGRERCWWCVGKMLMICEETLGWVGDNGDDVHGSGDSDGVDGLW